MVRNPWGVIGLSIITLGIYFIYWQYVTFRDLKDSSGEGIGGGLGLVFAIFIPIVNSFMLPSEVGRVFQRQGKVAPISGLTGFWLFLPIAGWFVWVVKVQGRLNEYWESGGLGLAVGAFAQPAAPIACESAACRVNWFDAVGGTSRGRSPSSSTGTTSRPWVLAGHPTELVSARAASGSGIANCRLIETLRVPRSERQGGYRITSATQAVCRKARI